MLSMPRIVRPDPRDSCARKLGPPLDWLLADPLSETKNSPNFQNVFPGCRKQSYGAASRLATLTSTNGRGFSTNQVQNAGAASLWIVDLSARCVLEAHARTTSCKLLSIVMTTGCPGSRSM